MQLFKIAEELGREEEAIEEDIVFRYVESMGNGIFKWNKATDDEEAKGLMILRKSTSGTEGHEVSYRVFFEEFTFGSNSSYFPAHQLRTRRGPEALSFLDHHPILYEQMAAIPGIVPVCDGVWYLPQLRRGTMFVVTTGSIACINCGSRVNELNMQIESIELVEGQEVWIAVGVVTTKDGKRRLQLRLYLCSGAVEYA